MDYYVRMSQGRTVTDRDTRKETRHVSFYYLPAQNKEHARSLVDALNNGSGRHLGNVFDHTFDVVASVWSRKGRVYLDMMVLERIADEYTNPDNYKVAAE